ncbi:MAG: hypothetical protein JRH18_07615 [Deltaproteobacteria bacterium]|nr:hypothetical protein [Deltaproteobacteria bacterium]MBW1962182.1 hypothetical protein [Deltaproteobacteria bacterium]MBW2151519.1 hypothetical protein [Deltaproteobacteria bacterium]
MTQGRLTVRSKLVNLMVGCLFGFMVWIIISISVGIAAEKLDCDIQNRSCTKDLGNVSVTFDIQPKPVRAMHDLVFTVRFKDGMPQSSPYIDLGMPGMNMGANRVLLKTVGSGVYKGKGIIVRCPSGNKIWRATLTAPGLGRLVFTFRVLYSSSDTSVK